ncbi:MAG: hypothetical protein GY761_00825 [Hyphomicrobiales bacterium]|nr:hypothetical protein [Hyphomicrobiales bacterium]
MTDGDKLRALADWHDANDKTNGRSGSEVQEDLRRIANLVDMCFPPEINVNVNDLKDDPLLWSKSFVDALKKGNWTIDRIDERLMFAWFWNAIALSYDYRMKHGLSEIKIPKG